MEKKVRFFDSFETFLEENKKNQKKYLIYTTPKTDIDMTLLNDYSIEVYGAFFPQLIYNGELYDKGLIAFPILPNCSLSLIKNINEPTFSSLKDIQSVVTLLDAFSEHNEKFLQKLYSKVSLSTNIIGGGAGSLAEPLEGALFSNEGFYNDAAILLKLDIEIHVGVRHGWEYLRGPFLVTKSEKNRLYGIDYKDAFELYASVIYEDSGITLTKENYHNITPNYPIGLIKHQGEQIIRDPIRYEDDAFVLVGEVKENSLINILKGEKSSLLEAANDAAQQAIKKNSSMVLVFDCLSRVAFLKDAFNEELAIMEKNRNAQVVGAITLGEIANEGKKFIHFYNKTCVIGGVCF